MARLPRPGAFPSSAGSICYLRPAPHSVLPPAPATTSGSTAGPIGPPPACLHTPAVESAESNQNSLSGQRHTPFDTQPVNDRVFPPVPGELNAPVETHTSSPGNLPQKPAPGSTGLPFVLPGRAPLRTALEPSSLLGWAEIRHPFHPLRGQRFEVLKKRRVAGADTLILRELERGTFSVPREWTDWADPSPYDSLTLPPHRLAADCLFELVALLDALPASSLFSPGKDLQKRIDKGD